MKYILICCHGIDNSNNTIRYFNFNIQIPDLIEYNKILSLVSGEIDKLCVKGHGPVVIDNIVDLSSMGIVRKLEPPIQDLIADDGNG